MKITHTLLRKFNACDEGFALVKLLLPMTFDKDVENNIDTAIRLIETYDLHSQRGGMRWLFDDLEWLLRVLTLHKMGVTQLGNMSVMKVEAYSQISNNTLDPLTVAQIMSWIADKDKVKKWRKYAY